MTDAMLRLFEYADATGQVPGLILAVVFGLSLLGAIVTDLWSKL